MGLIILVQFPNNINKSVRLELTARTRNDFAIRSYRVRASILLLWTSKLGVQY
nr:MAG TPA: hypothetical protein [Caudoviricetes sp.]